MPLTIKSAKQVEQWSSKDIFMYFIRRYNEEFPAYHLKVPNEAWPAFLSRIKGFSSKLHISPQQYKDFIDTVFSMFLSIPERKVFTFGAIVSEKVYYLSKHKKTGTATQLSQDEWETFRNSLYSDPLLFKNI